MGNSLELDEAKVYSLEKFQKETSKKMTIHILSNKKEDCIELIEFLTKENIQNNSLELLEKNIQKKVNLYSFMNYKIYENASTLNEKIAKIVENESNNPQNKKFSEVVIILNNDKINEQIKYLRKNDVFNSTEHYYIPFLIIISPDQLDLKGFIGLKTFQYKTNLKGIRNFFGKQKKEKEEKEKEEKEKEEKEKEEKEEKEEVSKFFKKLNSLFSYYNELGDQFTFINSDEKKVPIIIEDETNDNAFINFLLLGRSGSGKSTLINLLLEEKKSLEGGNGLSATSKEIIIYKKSDAPIRFYDVKGIEDEVTLENYLKILSDFKENINAIFYCIDYKIGTTVEKMEEKLFKKLIKFKIPIIFIITKTPYVVNTESTDLKNSTKMTKQEKARKKDRNKMENAIKSFFLKENKEEGQKFIENYVNIFFVNLKNNISLGVPVFGIDKVLSFFTQSVDKDDWEKLEKSCIKNDEKTFLEYCKKNPFLKNYSDLKKLNSRNKIEAENYLEKLKIGAFFTGTIPGLDIGMEYLYNQLMMKELTQSMEKIIV